MALPPPFLSVPGIPNFRALGGQPTDFPSRIIRADLVFRSVEPSKVTAEGEAAVTALGITHVYDLRSNIEIRTQMNVNVHELPGTQRVFVPVFSDIDYSPEALALRFSQYGTNGTEGFVNAYRTILQAAAGPFAKILSHLAAPEPTPLLVHCTAGKDRTGLICAIILSLCGVQDQFVAEEYSLTEVGLRHRRQELIDHLLQKPALNGDREAVERMIGARPESMIAALKMLRDEYGSVQDYVTKHCGLTPQAVERIRQNMTMDAGAVTDVKASM
ncbi:tyrosine phosphatase family protein [Sarocladium implicatum]|nr:tyrosine phosphatase family protein [Sarocladium implicatum]